MARPAEMEAHVFRFPDTFSSTYISDGCDCRKEDGSLPAYSTGVHQLSVDRMSLSCRQSPTSPTMDELLGPTVNERTVDAADMAETVLRLTAQLRDHIFTLHAEVEANTLAPYPSY